MISGPMTLLIDENVPESVADFFRERGHNVLSVRDVLLPGTPDSVIAKYGNQIGAIVVTWNHKDFKKLITRVPDGLGATFHRLGRINFRCVEPRGRQRAEDLIDLIEFEYDQCQRLTDKRIMMEIGERSFKSIR